MAIIRPATSRSEQALTASEFDFSKVPFIPAYDLLTGAQAALSDAEAVAVACALHQLTSDDKPSKNGNWSIQARLEAVSQRK